MNRCIKYGYLDVRKYESTGLKRSIEDYIREDVLMEKGCDQSVRESI